MSRKKVSQEDAAAEVTTRKVIQIHDTFYVSIPVSFRERHGIKKGDRMAVVTGKNMTVSPLKDA
jgi:bifunctional DNA-binding transcriptional regulator/antitoxin component of YhaV-PrlF toxin-antitoxin module